MQYIDCKKYANEVLEQVKAVPNKKELRILTVGNNAASLSYVRGKIKDCEYCGIPYSHIKIDNSDTARIELEYQIVQANSDYNVGGIIVQMPLPNGFDNDRIINQIRFDKDIDGFKEHSPFEPCTPEGIMYILKKELGDLTGKKALVVGRGKLVGEPIAKMLLAANCTVTIAHSKTKDLNWELLNADIIVTAVGKPNTINLELCRNADIVIDAGISRDENGKLVGDCYNFDPDNGIGLKVTSVPGGVGLMTRAMLMKHMARI